MSFLRDLSIRTKLLLLAGTSVGVALSLACLGFSVNEYQMAREQKVEELQAQANMLAFNSTVVLESREPRAAQRLMASLCSLPTVDAACLYDAHGGVLATFPLEGAVAEYPDPSRFRTSNFDRAGYLELFQPVYEGQARIGTLYLRANLSDFHQRLWKFGEIGVMVVMLSLASSVLLASLLQRAVSAPILRLAAVAETVGRHGDYSLRVERASHDELGRLYIEFNRLLERSESWAAALQNAHDQLESRVIERTAELRQEIAERERTQAELVEAKNAAEAANVAKSRFLANMSHEIRTPLNAILGFAELLRRDDERWTRDERIEHLETVLVSGKHLLCLINDILDLSKIEADRLQVERIRCSPHEIITEILSTLRVRALEKGLNIEYRWLSHVPESIETDPGRFRQLLMNLVSNAIKFTRVGGVRMLCELDVPKQSLRVQVADTGVGIPADKLESIFDPFVQADNSVTREFGGTGLGLTISRRIAQALGGTIEVASEPGRGSTFTVTVASGDLNGVALLSSPPADGLKRSHKEQAAPVSLPPAHVLLVEDGDTNRKLIGLVLRRAGLDVATACNGQIAVDLAGRHPFDLILMDMQMPVMDGYTATTQLRQAGLDVPIVALTAHAMKGDEQKCRAAGCSGYLTKPIDPDLLLRTLAELLGCTAAAPAARNVRPDALVSTLPVDDPDFREIVEEFIERLGEQLAAMRKALDERDGGELARLAHWLKGSGGTAGFPQFTDPARELEMLAKTGEWQRASHTVENLAGLAQRVAVCAETAI